MVNLHLPAVMKYIIGLGGHTFLHYTEMSNRVWYNYSYPLSEGLCATHQSVQCALFVLSLLDHLPILRQLRRKLFVTPTSINGHGWLGQWARIPTFSSGLTDLLAIITIVCFHICIPVAGKALGTSSSYF